MRQINVDVGDSYLFRVVVGSHSMAIPPIFKTVSVQNQTLDIIAASTFCAESTSDFSASASNLKTPILRISGLDSESGVDDHSLSERTDCCM